MIKLYPNSFETALKNGNYDIGLYMASCKENIKCARDIEKAINKNFDGYKLGKGFEKDIIETYGFQRVNFGKYRKSRINRNQYFGKYRK